VFIVSFIVCFVCFTIIIPLLKSAGIVGKNMNSEAKEKIVKMRGLVIVAGFGAGMVVAIDLRTFFDYGSFDNFNPYSSGFVYGIDSGENRYF